MQLKFNNSKNFGTIVTEKAPSRADYLLNDAITTMLAQKETIAGIRRYDVCQEQREMWIREEESKEPRVGDEFVLPEDNSAFYFVTLPNGKRTALLYLKEKNTGRLVRLFCSSIFASVGNLAPMIKKDSSYDERFFGKTISIDNMFYEEVPVFGADGCIRAIRNHRVYEINIKD